MFAAFLSIVLFSSVGWSAEGPPIDEELRGIWVTRWTYSSKADVQRIMADVSDAGFNTVYFQVRGQHDAFYESSLEPWAKELTGTLGKNPGWDPLQIAVDSGHGLGLEVHAYVNAFTLWRSTAEPTNSSPAHAWQTDPDWLVADAEGGPMALTEQYVYASPGNRAVRDRLVQVVSEIAQRYKVDGIHLDHIRYPGSGYGYDMASLAAWEADGRPDFDGWRRSAVNAAVRAVSEVVNVPVSAAVWGVYTNHWDWPGVSEGRNEYFQDAEAFTRLGLVDALIPMVYWKVNPGGRLDFGAVVADHVKRANGRHVYAGVRADPKWGPAEVESAILSARKQGAQGVVLFEYSEAKPMFERLKNGVFARPAVPPKMDWR